MRKYGRIGASYTDDLYSIATATDIDSIRLY